MLALIASAVLLGYLVLLVAPAEFVALTTRDPDRRQTALAVLRLLLAPFGRGRQPSRPAPPHRPRNRLPNQGPEPSPDRPPRRTADDR